MTTSKNAGGRPRGELTQAERILLVERIERVRFFERELQRAEHEFGVAAKVAQRNGASVREIAEASGLSTMTAQRHIAAADHDPELAQLTARS
jgi:hypothetical protein